MIVNARMSRIIDWLQEKESITTEEVAKKFGISLITARRDMDRVTAAGFANRIYGGIVRKAQCNTPGWQTAQNDRSQKMTAEKRAIGRAAAALIDAHETVFLYIGSTIVQLAGFLADRDNLTVVTNSLAVVNILNNTKPTLFCTGGKLVHNPSETFLGDTALYGMRPYHIDQAFLGASGVSLEGGVSFVLPEIAGFATAVMLQSSVINIVADSSKIGISRMSSACPINCVQRIITDSGIDPVMAQAIRDTGVEVLIVDRETDAED